MPETTVHSLHIDGRWELYDLYDLPHRYAEVYSFFYALEFAETSQGSGAQEIFHRYPWRGGFSAVNFYDDLYKAIPKAVRPTIKSIRYASPGHIEILVYLGIAVAIGRCVVSLARQFDSIEQIYHGIYKRLQERKLLRVEVKERERKFTADEIKLLADSLQDLARPLGFTKAHQLRKLCGDDLGAIKMLMSFYRRLRELAEYTIEGKVRFPELEDEGKKK